LKPSSKEPAEDTDSRKTQNKKIVSLKSKKPGVKTENSKTGKVENRRCKSENRYESENRSRGE